MRDLVCDGVSGNPARSPFSSSSVDTWMGKCVYRKPGTVAVTTEGKVVEGKAKQLAEVQEVHGEFLWLQQAWVHKADVMHLEEATACHARKLMAARSDVMLAYFIANGSCWKELQNSIRPEETTRRPFASTPHCFAATVGLGFVSFHGKRFDDAVKEFSEAIRLDSSPVWHISGRGHALYGQGKVDAALDDFTEANRLDPSYSLIYVHRAHCWIRKNDLPKAIEDLKEGIRLNPRDVTTLTTLGWCFMAEETTKRQ